jgi:hypothetical protein
MTAAASRTMDCKVQIPAVSVCGAAELPPGATWRCPSPRRRHAGPPRNTNVRAVADTAAPPPSHRGGAAPGRRRGFATLHAAPRLRRAGPPRNTNVRVVADTAAAPPSHCDGASPGRRRGCAAGPPRRTNAPVVGRHTAAAPPGRRCGCAPVATAAPPRLRRRATPRLHHWATVATTDQRGQGRATTLAPASRAMAAAPWWVRLAAVLVTGDELTTPGALGTTTPGVVAPRHWGASAMLGGAPSPSSSGVLLSSGSASCADAARRSASIRSGAMRSVQTSRISPCTGVPASPPAAHTHQPRLRSPLPLLQHARQRQGARTRSPPTSHLSRWKSW